MLTCRYSEPCSMIGTNLLSGLETTIAGVTNLSGRGKNIVVPCFGNPLQIYLQRKGLVFNINGLNCTHATVHLPRSTFLFSICTLSTVYKPASFSFSISVTLMPFPCSKSTRWWDYVSPFVCDCERLAFCTNRLNLLKLAGFPDFPAWHLPEAILPIAHSSLLSRKV